MQTELKNFGLCLLLHISFPSHVPTTDAGEATANADYTAVYMAVIYNNQKNEAYIDDLCLFKEGCKVIYDNDDWGRVEKMTEIDGFFTEYIYEVDAVIGTVADNRIQTVYHPDGVVESTTPVYGTSIATTISGVCG